MHGYQLEELMTLLRLMNKNLVEIKDLLKEVPDKNNKATIAAALIGNR